MQHSVCGVTRIISIDPCYIHSPVSHLFTLAVHIHSYHTYSVSLCTFTHIISIHPGCIHSFLSYLFTLAAHIHCNHIYSVVLYTFTHVISVKHCMLHTFIGLVSTKEDVHVVVRRRASLSFSDRKVTLLSATELIAMRDRGFARSAELFSDLRRARQRVSYFRKQV